MAGIRAALRGAPRHRDRGTPAALPAMTVRTVLASPLLHFFVLGGLIFALYAAVSPRGEAPVRSDALVVSQEQAARLAEEFAATWSRPPSAQELEGLIDDWLMEEALVREALALGLDRGDPMVRNRLRQKMVFLAEAPVAGLTPDDETLAAHFEANARRYAAPAVVSFAQILLPADASPADADALKTRLEGGADPALAGRATLLPGEVGPIDVAAAGRTFGGGFAAALAGLPVGRWSGPVPSAYGEHLVRIESRSPAAAPPLERVRDRVLADWRAEESRRLREAYARSLLDRYTVERPSAASILQR